jgi:hypothetical protein
MTLEELEALITEKFTTLTEQVGGLESKILSEVDRRNRGVATSVTNDVAKTIESLKSQIATPEAKPGEKSGEGEGETNKERPTVKAVQTELQKLRDELAIEKAALARTNRESALKGLLSGKSVLAPSTLFNALNAQYGEKLQKDGDQWFVVDGDNAQALEAVIDGFLATDEGKAFLPPSGVNGAGSREGSSTTSATSQDLSASQMLMAAVSGLG